MAKSRFYYIRKTHRYLGVILGIQFLLWTLGGLYFSWTNIDEIHGDFQRKHVPILPGNIRLSSPDQIFNQVAEPVDSISTIQLINVMQKPMYSITYYSQGKLKKLLADAQSAAIRAPITKNEAIEIAKYNFADSATLKSVEFITSTTGHHEYRGKPLPAWAVSFEHPSNTTLYISADYSRVESFRNDKWRLFDFLWMMHTMDYNERDNINNWLLRIFSIFGLLTILSGFALFWITRQRKTKKQGPVWVAFSHYKPN
jgi:hypothetical protein